jgi:hypothetical protein
MSEVAKGRQWTAEFIAERLSKLKETPRVEREPSPAMAELHEAAAVLAHYDASELQSFAKSQTTNDSVEDVLRNSTIVYSEGAPKSMLQSETRRTILQRLGSAEAIRSVLQRIPERPRNVLQRMLDGYVLGRPKLLDLQNLDELAATLQVSQWFSGLLKTLPDPRDLERRIEREAVLKPFKDLAGSGFVGRESELSMLRSYVGVLESRSTFETVQRGVRHYITGYKPLMIHAPGGMGKSALIARFILDHLDPTEASPALPFVYLDFDRPALLPERFSTLLDEAARQLAATSTSLPKDAPHTRRRWVGADEERLIPEFVEVARTLGVTGDVPLLFVLDTFEEVQYRSRDIAESVLGFFGRLQAALPAVRVVIAGRASVESSRVAVDNRPLGPLKPEDAAKFLHEREIDDPVLAQHVADQVGGSPLSLRLALEVIRKEKDALGSSGIRDLTTRNAFFLRLRDNQIQGQLYRRILGHIRNEDVQKLAHPGLVLRRVTEEIILKVLAGPCGVAVRDIDHARELFQEMQREVSLVSINVDGSLQHVPEVRTIMLDLLKEDRPKQVREIQEKAIAYYRTQDGPRARAELIYHLLMLRRNPSEVDAVWQQGVEPLLRASLPELPVSSRAYLAARLGEEVAKSVLAELQIPALEARALMRVRDHIAVNRTAEAVSLLAEVRGRSPGSVLHLPEAQARALTGDWAGALDVAVRALGESARIDDPETILKLEVVRAWAERHLTAQNPGEFRGEVESLFTRFAGDPLAMRFALHRLAIAPDEYTRSAIRSATAAFFRQIPSSNRDLYPMLTWDVAGAVGAEYSDVLFTVLQRGAPELQTLKAAFVLREAVSAWDAEQEGRIGWNRMATNDTPPGPELVSLLLSAITVYAVPMPVLKALAGIYGEAADSWRTDRHLYEEMEPSSPSSDSMAR